MAQRSELIELLNRADADPDEILSLAMKVAAENSERVRFVADAALIDRLGRELVGRADTAVSELVKNAFDADATKVDLVFTNCERPGGTLSIGDDGSGMTRVQVIDGFMRLSSTLKQHEPVSTRFKRRRAGKKGIGRFATQRLGSRLALTTQTISEPTAWKVDVNWDSFAPDDTLLLKSVPISQVPKERESGTKLLIAALRDAWSDYQLGRTFRNTVELFNNSPFRHAPGGESDPGFEVKFWRQEGQERTLIISAQQMLTQSALANVTAEVDADGIAHWKVVSSRLGLDDGGVIYAEDQQAPQRFPDLVGRVSLSAHYFVWEPGVVPAGDRAMLRELADSQGGIKLYRNGFRVAPYGERGDDWLSLDLESRRRAILVPLANTNWYGMISVNDLGERPMFEELSSREGLIRTPAFDQLIEFGRKALIAAAMRVGYRREKKVRAGEKRAKKRAVDTSPEALRNLADQVEASATKGSAQASSAADVIPQVLRLAADEKQDFLEERSMLRVLASLGTTIGEFTHELKHLFIPLQVSIAELEGRSSRAGNIEEPIRRLSDHLRSLQDYTNYFDKISSKAAQREVVPQDLSWLVHEFFGAFGKILEREQISVDLDQFDEGLVTRPMHAAEVFSVFANLLTNSLKAIKRTDRAGRGVVRVTGHQENNRLLVFFSDNGDGVPAQYRERIFDAFFTTTGSDDYLGGTGLGLKIVRDLLEAYDGAIDLVDPIPPSVTTFRIEIPAIQEEAS